MADSPSRPATNEGIQQYYHTKIDELQVCHLKRDSGCALIRIFQLAVGEKTQNVRRLEAQRNELNAKGVS